MPRKLSYKSVYDFINIENELISKEYNGNKILLDIKCKKCNIIFKQTYDRYKKGFRHNNCKNKLLTIKKEIKKEIKNDSICLYCNLYFKKKKLKQKFCSVKCANENQRMPNIIENAKINGSNGGKISASKKIKRSKNEIYFAELCIDYFGNENVTTNEPFFDRWDADIIIHYKKIAILYDGIWHRKKITKNHSLIQVQNRDKIKRSIIEKYNYSHYTIQDDGKYNKKFVEEAFELFLFSLINI
jgi:hypothetical protein